MNGMSRSSYAAKGLGFTRKKVARLASLALVLGMLMSLPAAAEGRKASAGIGCYGSVHAIAGQQPAKAQACICNVADTGRTTCDPSSSQLPVITYAMGDGSLESHGRSYAQSPDSAAVSYI